VLIALFKYYAVRKNNCGGVSKGRIEKLVRKRKGEGEEDG